MLVRLEYEGRTLHEISLEDVTDEIAIGRSKDCAWQVSGKDPVVSSRHAELFRKGKSLWIRDLQSKNGTFFRGRKIEKRRLKPGDQVGIGNHTLLAEKKTERAAGRAASELRVLTGKSRGHKQPLLPPSLTIGSDPVCGLALLDTLVSKRHAEIGVKEDGSCWIRDLGSKNGTMVNGLPLREDKERLLKNGDRIGIAHLEIEFHDGDSRRSGSQAWLRLGIAAATLGAALALYGAWMMMKPSSETYLNRARSLAALEDFEAARQILESAETARGAATFHAHRQDLRRRISVWENTARQWVAARAALERGDWVESTRRLGALQSERMEAWDWNERGVSERAAAALAKTMLDARLRAVGSLRRDDATVDALKKDRIQVQAMLDSTRTGRPAFLEKLAAELEATDTALEAALKESLALDTALEKLREPFPPYQEIVTTLETIVEHADGAVKRRATQVLEPIQGLARAFGALHAMADLTRAMAFDKLDGAPFALPSPEACAVDIRVSNARGALERIHDQLRAAAAQTAHTHRTVRNLMGGDTSVLPGLDMLENNDTLNKVFACDTLQFEIPRRTRSNPVGEYDRLLGVEEFYMQIRTLPEKMDPTMALGWPFPSLLTRTEETFRKIRELDAFLNEPANRWLLGGRLADEMNRLKGFLGRGDAIVSAMLQEAARRQGRERLIAGGIAMKLAPDPAALTVGETPLVRWLAGEMRTLRETLAEMNNAYRRAAPARQIELRAAMLKTGLPGDPMLRGMWVMQSSSRQ